MKGRENHAMNDQNYNATCMLISLLVTGLRKL